MSSEGPLTAHRPERVAVVIPAKNEADRIEATIDAARALHGVDIVVVVDDGSTDSTAAVAMGADALVVRHKTNRGKAAAMATGAQLVQMREDTDRADGGDSFIEELHAEPREPGHTGPLPVIDPAPAQPRALLFLDADMGASASGAQPLVDAVLEDGVDMAIALLPPQEGAAGMGFVVRTARRGIEKATGWTPTQPLSGTRCITRETWEACQPLAAGWGVETSLTIDALTGGFWVKEIEAELHHRATGSDLRGQLHRAAQLRDVLRALARRRTIAPEPPVEIEPETPLDDIEETGEHEVRSAPDAPVAPGRDAVDLADLPVTSTFSDEQTRALADADIAALDRLLRDLPVDADFAPDDAVFLAGTDLDLLATRLHDAPVTGTFTPEQAVIIASHLDAGEPAIPPSLDSPLTPDEYASLVVHAAVDAENSAKSDS